MALDLDVELGDAREPQGDAVVGFLYRGVAAGVEAGHQDERCDEEAAALVRLGPGCRALVTHSAAAACAGALVVVEACLYIGYGDDWLSAARKPSARAWGWAAQVG